jgi:hypothetical protein
VRCSLGSGLTTETINRGSVFRRLGPLLSGLATGVGNSTAGRQWFGEMPVQMDVCCFSSSFRPFNCVGGNQ